MSRPRHPTSAAVARVGHAEYRLTQQTHELAARVMAWQSSLIRSPQHFQPAERLALCILLTMGICERHDINGIAISGEVFGTSDGPMLSWQRSDGRRGARQMSSLALLAWSQYPDVQCAGHLEATLLRALLQVDTSLADQDDPLCTVLAACEAWCHLELPQLLFAHVCGDLPMTPLSRSTYSRLDSGCALPSGLEPASVADDSSMDAMQGYWLSSGEDRSNKVLQSIMASARLHQTAVKSDRELLDDLACNFRGHIDAAEVAGPLTCLQLACALSLVADGRHKPRTIIAYVKAGMVVVHNALSTVDLEELDSDSISERLSSALQTVHGQARVNAAAYIGHFWRYASQWINVASLSQKSLPDVVPSPVDANVVWSHECALMERWLNGSQPDPDLARQTRLVLRLLSTLPVRISEVLFLQIRNVYALNDNKRVCIEVARRGRPRGLKSPHSQRVLSVDGALAAELLEYCDHRRIEHNGLGNPLLFGTKAEPDRVYRLGAMYAWLNGAVKRATGDLSSCCHHFRHAAIDSNFAKMSIADIERGALEQLRVDAGHADLGTTLRSYLHRYGPMLKACIESSIEQMQRLTDTAAAVWIGQSSACLRQSLSRQRRRNHAKPSSQCASASSPKAWYWSRVHVTAQAVKVPPSSSVFALCCGLEPAACPPHRPWSVIDLIDFLGDVESGATVDQARRQRRIPQDVGDLAIRELLRLGQERMSETRDWGGLLLTDPAAALAACDLRIVAAHQPKYRPWLEHLSQVAPVMLPDSTWGAWWRSSRGQYIRLGTQSERWLAYLLSTGFPTQNLLACVDELHAQTAYKVSRILRHAVALSGSPGPQIRIAETRYNNRRGRAYLLVANAGDTRTDRTGAAFSVAGLKVIMMAVRLASLASNRLLGGSS